MKYPQTHNKLTEDVYLGITHNIIIYKMEFVNFRFPPS